MNNQETSFSLAFKNAYSNMSNRKQTENIAKHIYESYPVFKSLKPLAIGIDKVLIAQLTQYDQKLVLRVLSTHCKNFKYLNSLITEKKRYNLDNKPVGVVSQSEKDNAQKQLDLKTNNKVNNKKTDKK